MEVDIKLENTDSCKELQVETIKLPKSMLSRRTQRERLEFMGLDFKTFIPDEPGKAWKTFVMHLLTMKLLFNV